MSHSIEITVGGQSESARGPLSGAHAPCSSLYIHVPFCFHKCHYCDFYSIVDTSDRFPRFVDRLVEELRFLAPHAGRLRSIFVGGGTPTLLGASHWVTLLAEMGRLFSFGPGSGEAEAPAEFTVECNPETATPELMGALRDGGVNRISVGAQSFNRTHLATLERWHDPENVARALELARDAGIGRRSVDLIFAVPGQTLDDWASDLEIALALPIDHLSCYALTYEPNTPMTARLRRGEFEATDEDDEAAMYEHTVRRLAGAGFERYEVSNFARRDAGGRPSVSAHNLAYWRCDDWLAAGPSGAAHVGGHRWKNVARLTEWMEGIERNAGASPITDHEPPDARRALAERLMMSLRIAEGLDERATIERAAALGCAGALASEVEAQIGRAMIERADGAIRLTDRGFLFADGIASRLMTTLDARG